MIFNLFSTIVMNIKKPRTNAAGVFYSIIYLNYDIFSNWSLPTPHAGHTQSAGIDSKDVPAAIPPSGSPIAGS